MWGSGRVIAIKEIEMPENCSDCDLCHGHICKISGTDIVTNPKGNCPLVEIVTCKDCKHWHDDGIMTTCDKNIGNGFPKDYYCADGERRK